jgi:large subunit ribosomal protein L32e
MREKSKMSDIKVLLEKRKETKRKKPLFIRKDIYKKGRVGKSWRKPRGLDNKQRLCKRGPAKKISNGYRAPKEVRGLHKSGLIPVIVSNISQLNSLTKEQGVILSARVGNKKRQMLITEAKKKDLVLLNLDADKTLEKIQAELKQRQDSRKKALETDKEKKKSIEEKVKKPELKEETSKQKLAVPEKLNFSEIKEEVRKEEPQLSDEEKKKLEKEEKDKLLTKRE